MKTTKYVGKRFYALVSRMGGRYIDIHALSIYEFKENGVPKKIGQAMNCVANKSQYAALKRLTNSCGYVSGRPTAARMNAISDNELNKLCAN